MLLLQNSWKLSSLIIQIEWGTKQFWTFSNCFYLFHLKYQSEAALLGSNIFTKNTSELYKYLGTKTIPKNICQTRHLVSFRSPARLGTKIIQMIQKEQLSSKFANEKQGVESEYLKCLDSVQKVFSFPCFPQNIQMLLTALVKW